MTENEVTVAAVDWEAYEREASAAVAAASSPVELDDARVRYLGRKSELAQALRGVRDRESGMLLNGIRERLEAAVAEREQRLVNEELDRRLRDEVVDVTLPGEQLPVGHLHPITQVRRIVEDSFLGLGYEIRDDREVETVREELSRALTDQRREPALILWPGDSIRKCSVTEVVHNESCHGIYGDAPITRDGCRNSADIELEVVLVSFSLKPRTLACGNGMTGPRHRIEYE